MASDDDEDIKRAIALSLGQDDPGKVASKEVIDLDDDYTSPMPTSTVDVSEEKPESKHSSQTKAGELRPMLGLDRAQMETERLARKRKRSPTQSIEPAQVSKHSNTSQKFPLQYPRPTVKRTWVRDQARLGDDITLREVLQPSDLRLAVLSSFQWDMSWVFSHLNRNTKKILVMQAKEASIREQYLDETKDVENLRLCFPNMQGQINCMHSKLMILSYEKHLRVVVPTANLVPYDWGETGTMENCVFLVDLLRLPDKQRVEKKDLTLFGSELLHFLEAKGLDQHVLDSLCSFDFSTTKDAAFVHTIGGANMGQQWRRTGYPGLSNAVNALQLSTRTPKIDFVASSIGALNIGFLSRIQRACSGDDFSHDIARKKIENKNAGPTEISANDFRIYFPTHNTVVSSLAGSAGTICMQPNYYDSPKFPRHLLYDCRSKREGVLMHNKIMYVRPKDGQAWAYVGSANCSESAWGNQVTKDRVTKEPKLNCRNWECGVLLKCPTDTTGEGLGVFEGTIPVPMKWPGEEYGGKRPWFFMGDR